ncbi:hypothetical protein PFISCL1PPCAC_15800, partial [Pristionchus fissidentatus]
QMREDTMILGNPLWKECIHLWINRRLDICKLKCSDRSVLTKPPLDCVPGSSNDRQWFAGSSSLLPISESTSHRNDLSTLLARVLIAAVIERDSGNSSLFLERAEELCESSLHETRPFDVAELATVTSEDDDELIVILDAILRLRDGIRPESPLHPQRLVLQVMTANGFEEGSLLELLFDDESGATAAFPMISRLFEWATTDRLAVEGAARAWIGRHLGAGRWEEGVNEEEEEEE